MKKLLLIVVDAFSGRVLAPAIQKGRLPNIQALSETGSLNPECIAIFPSLTPAATASIVTGQYPHKHCVLGFHWYDLATREVIYYGDDFWVLWNGGFGRFFDDFLYQLNHKRLQADTLFQAVERSGLKAANLNYLIFRGDIKHTTSLPLPFNLLTGVSSLNEVYGPSIMYFGDFVNTDIEIGGESLYKTGGPFHRFGFDDDNTASLLIQLAEKRALPDLTVAYFPDNDFHSHEAGPAEAVGALEKVDARLGDLLAACGGLDRMLREFCVVLTGDHSQTDMLADRESAGIRLDELLADFSIAETGVPPNQIDQLVVCPNMRAAQIYFQTPNAEQLERVVSQLLTDPRVDQAIWRTEGFGGKKHYHVATGDRGEVHFWPGTDGPNTAVDRYEGRWSWTGDLRAVDGAVSPDNLLTFSEYPNAFERIVGGLECTNSGHVWATARPGHEFCLPETSIHLGGGSHGSLHVLDSLSPLLVAGAPDDVELPSHPRAVDINPLCLSILGLKPQQPIGASRIGVDGNDQPRRALF